jgi:hypothetical protein
MSLGLRIMGGEGGTATVDGRKARQMKDHDGVLMMQRALLAGTLGLAMARKAAAILEGEPDHEAACSPTPRTHEGAVLRAILDAANECVGHFDDRPPGERWCDTLFHLLDLAAFAGEIGARLAGGGRGFLRARVSGGIGVSGGSGAAAAGAADGCDRGGGDGGGRHGGGGDGHGGGG